MTRTATLRDVATHAGVSVATVSHVLNNRKRVTPEVFERVQRAVTVTGYRPNTAARALRTGRTKTLGLLVPDIANPFFPQLAKAVEARAKREGYATVLLESGYEASEETRALSFMEERRVDGLIWVLSGAGRLPPRPLPFATVIMDYAPNEWFAVHADDYAGGRLQARHALDLGHRRALGLWGPMSVTSIRERRRGFLDEAAGRVALVEELEAPFALELSPTVQERLLARRGEYSFLVCGNDLLAIAALNFLKGAGVRIPGELSIIGFDDTPLCRIVDPPLSSIAQSPEQIGTLAVESLLKQLHEEAARPHHIVVPVEVRARSSTGPGPASAEET